MAADLTAQLASIVAAYLRKRGFSKALAAFSRENGEMTEEEDSMDLETLYKFYISSQLKTSARTKKSKKMKIGEGDENLRDNAEEKANGRAASDSKKKKKEREILGTDSPVVHKTQGNKTPKEEGSKKKRKDSQPGEANGIGESLEAVNNGQVACDSAPKESFLETHVDNGRGLLATQQEIICCERSLDKKAKKERKELGGESKIPKGTELLDSGIASAQKDGSSKKKSKKVKDDGGEETKDAVIADSTCKTPINLHTEQSVAPEQQSAQEQQSGGLVGLDRVVKKKKRTNDTTLEDSGILKSSIEENGDAKGEETKNAGEPTDSKKQSRKKRKLKEDTTPVNGTSNQDHNSMDSPEKTKEAGTGEAADERNVERHDSGSAKTKKHEEIPNNKTPSGALAFRRIEVEKVTFSDARLSDNSYWAKDGAEEGYGAKAQNVLGLVRGRDFRHEKTKKKRGSYRGGLIGMESHSIKFENSDDE